MKDHVILFMLGRDRTKSFFSQHSLITYWGEGEWEIGDRERYFLISSKNIEDSLGRGNKTHWQVHLENESFPRNIFTENLISPAHSGSS